MNPNQQLSPPRPGVTILRAQTHVVAPKCVVGVAGDDLSDTINAINWGISSVGRINGRVHETSGLLCTPCGLSNTCQRYLELMTATSSTHMFRCHGTIHDSATGVLVLLCGIANLADGCRERRGCQDGEASEEHEPHCAAG